MQRREFLATAATVGAAAVAAHAWAAAPAPEATIEVLLDEPIASIAPEIYGHFTEHLGGVIYDGVWVGEDSKIPNVRGIRSALVEKLRAINAPVIRWPGGCFADSYDWRDGIGPRAKRPRRTNFWVDSAKRVAGSVQQFEPNIFGTSEFADFCRQSGAAPYLAANLRSLPPLAFDQWVEFCNAPAGSTNYADTRAASGSPSPYGVKYWGVGNESWGCGGEFTPEEYAAEYRRFTSWVPRYGVDLKFIASGPNGDDVDWTTRFFEETLGRRAVAPPFGWSVHNYTSGSSALDFDAPEAYATFARGFTTEKILLDHWAALGPFDRRRRVRLVVDEYGTWYGPGTQVDPSHIFGQQITMRDAIVTAFTLDIFNRQADKVGLAACAQLINCINSLFLAHGADFLTTPNYHVFDLYQRHQGAQAVRTEFGAPAISYMPPAPAARRGGAPPAAPSAASFWGLNGSASVRDGRITITVVNPSQADSLDVEIRSWGGRLGVATARVLGARDIHSHNTFEQPDAVRPRTLAVAASAAGTLRCTLPPASVTAISAAGAAGSLPVQNR